MRECGGRTICIHLIPGVQDCDETVVQGEYMEDFAVRKNIPFKISDHLVHSDLDPASILLGDCQRFGMAIELTRLPSPISADLFLSDNPAAL
jgi:hypothetical protein